MMETGYDQEEEEDIEYPEHILTASAEKQPGFQTLRELAKGHNSDAARNEIEDKVYVIATLSYFMALKLEVSSGGPSPCIFDTNTRQLVQEHPRLNTTRGTGGDIIVIDEAAHISLDLFYETILPMLELTNTALLAISTPLDEFNYYSKLVEQKDENGELFFKTIKAGRVCDDCSRLSHEEMIKCTHVEDTTHWKNPHKLKRLKVLYEGDEARGLRELGGIAASDYTPCFQKEDIATLFNNPRHVTRVAPEALYVTVDPSGGGASKMAIASGYFDGPRLVITGLEAQGTKTHSQQKHLIIKHIRRLRQQEFFSNAPIWLIAENNLGLESSHIEKYVRKMKNVHVFYENEDDRSGVRKTHQNTSDYQIQVEDMLQKSKMFFDWNLFTVSKGHEKPDGDTKSITDELRNQLERYHVEVKLAVDSFGKDRLTMTGKMGGAQDDLYIATAMLAFWPEVMRHQMRSGKRRRLF